MNFLQFSNSKKDSFRRNYSQKYGTLKSLLVGCFSFQRSNRLSFSTLFELKHLISKAWALTGLHKQSHMWTSQSSCLRNKRTKRKKNMKHWLQEKSQLSSLSNNHFKKFLILFLFHCKQNSTFLKCMMGHLWQVQAEWKCWYQSNYIEVAQGGVFSRARHNLFWIFSLFSVKNK